LNSPIQRTSNHTIEDPTFARLLEWTLESEKSEITVEEKEKALRTLRNLGIPLFLMSVQEQDSLEKQQGLLQIAFQDLGYHGRIEETLTLIRKVSHF
jgi:hypothetical protein